ncbi:MAG: SMR family transporter [Acidimicrobiia bacterium]
MSYVYLGVAIAAEIVGTTLLKVSDGFTILWAGAGTLAAYAVSFYFLSLTLRTVPVGVAYAVWSAVGIVVISLIGWIAFEQRLNAAAIAGIALVVAGVVILQVALAGGQSA